MKSLHEQSRNISRVSQVGRSAVAIGHGTSFSEEYGIFQAFSSILSGISAIGVCF
jgi:hypothetical protein